MEILGPNEQRVQRYWSRIQRALQVLQKAQRYDYGSTTYMEAPLQPSESGDWIAVDDVVKAIQILEGQQ
jgi:hypothetical protein